MTTTTNPTKEHDMNQHRHTSETTVVRCGTVPVYRGRTTRDAQWIADDLNNGATRCERCDRIADAVNGPIWQ